MLRWKIEVHALFDRPENIILDSGIIYIDSGIPIDLATGKNKK